MKKIFTTFLLFFSLWVCQAQFTISPMVQSVEGFAGDEITASVVITATGLSTNQYIFNMFMCQWDEGYKSGMTDGILSGGQSQTITFKFKKPTVSATHSFTYTFTINQATDRCSDDSNHIKITVTYKPQVCNLPTPTGLTSTVLSHTHSKLNWTKNASAASYEFRYKKTTDLNYTFETFTCGTTCEKFLYNLIPNTSYIWSVKAICSNGLSTPYASDKIFTTQACPTTAVPTNITATPYNGGFFISYTPVTDFYSCYMEYVDLTNNNTGAWGILQTSTPVNNFYAIPQTHDFKFRLFSTVCQRYTDWITVSGVPVSCTLTPPSTSTFSLVSMCGSSTPGSQCGVGQFSWGGVSGANRYEIQWNVFNLSGQSYSGSFQVPASQTNGSINGMGAPSSGGPWYATFRVRVRCTNNIWSDFSSLSNMFTW